MGVSTLLDFWINWYSIKCNLTWRASREIWHEVSEICNIANYTCWGWISSGKLLPLFCLIRQLGGWMIWVPAVIHIRHTPLVLYFGCMRRSSAACTVPVHSFFLFPQHCRIPPRFHARGTSEDKYFDYYAGFNVHIVEVNLISRVHFWSYCVWYCPPGELHTYISSLTRKRYPLLWYVMHGAYV